MSLTRELFVEEVAKQINNNHAALFMGAGVSASTGLPSWTSIISPLAEQLKISISNETDYYQIAQFYENEFKRNGIVREFEKRIHRVYADSEYLNAALDLGFHEIWTTNYDRVIETGLEKRRITPKVINSDHNLNSLTDGGVCVFKLNGDIVDPQNMVITKEDLERYPKSHELMLTFLKKELVAKSFLFLGYSFSDTLILNNLAMIKNCLSDSCTVHYAIFEKGEKSTYFVDDLFNRYNIQVLLVDSKSDYPVVLKEIREKCIERRVFISGSFDVLPPSEDDFANELCASLAESLYKNDYSIVSGMGRKLGNYLAGHAYSYLSKECIYDIERKLLMRPFYEKMSPEEKTEHRINMISESNICIFMFGKSPSDDGTVVISNGVREEFEIAKKHNKAIIPLPTTKYTSEKIFDDVSKHIVCFPYLEPYISDLKNSITPQALSSVVVKICDDYLRWRNQAKS